MGERTMRERKPMLSFPVGKSLLVLCLILLGDIVRVTSDKTSVPSIEVDCAIRWYAYEFALERLPWSSSLEHDSIGNALRLQECPKSLPAIQKLEGFSRSMHRGLRKPADKQRDAQTKNRTPIQKIILDHPHDRRFLFVDPTNGNDDASGSIVRPLRSIEAALEVSRARKRKSNQSVTIVLFGGTYFLKDTLSLDARDNGLDIVAYPDQHPILSGGDPLTLTMRPTPTNKRIYTGRLPIDSDRLYNFTMLFLDLAQDNDDVRLVWAREPNGHPEVDLQPDGYARANGSTGRIWPDTDGAVHIVIGKDGARNSSVYPYYGEDLDPRGGGNWLHLGGTGNRFVDRKGFWNGTVPMGLWVNTSELRNVSEWTPQGIQPAIAHIFHNAFWGNWQFEVSGISGLAGKTSRSDRTPDTRDGMTEIRFSRGGWQEGRGGAIQEQPFFVEGVREALDVPGEWWLDVPKQELLYYPFGNETTRSSDTTVGNEEIQIKFIAPRLQRLLSIEGPSEEQVASNITISGVTFAHSATTFLEGYEVPSPGDWSIHRGAAVVLENVEGVTIQRCRFLRTGGNALLLSGHAKNSTIHQNEFAWIGDSAIVTLGKLALADGFTVNTFPEDTLIEANHFHEIGIHGKQTSALFSALSCRTRFLSNVAYNGPRAGININDQFCHGHLIQKNLLFNWVRETQDHGPINTWDRAMYFQRQPDTQPIAERMRDEETPTTTPEWAHIDKNFIFNGPSGNRDLGNLFPTIDNDDGSSYYSITKNLLVYGGAKNYLGHDKRWISNLLIFPGRWSGDPCAQIWGGENHYFETNTCLVAAGDPPIGLDGSTKGFQCKIDWEDPQANLPFVGKTAGNVYYLEDPKDTWGFWCGNGTASNHFFSMDELKDHQWEFGSQVLDGTEFTADVIINLARALLQSGYE